ncbi:MAG: FimV/HubP family polar landmark protein [Woeseiaceae bacterium]|nr:FimV/HubP family polar landmark protein [Woeseiaceae bacterium]
MSRRLIRILPALVLSIMSSGAWAIGLGDITLDSALNEPLRAEIQLLSATPEELQDLKITLASADTFERYGLDRPAYLQGIQFNIVRGRGIVQLRTPAPVTEPFLTFIIEANWPRGRLLREYTVLLDPPTFAPPVAQQQPAVQAPSRAAPTDSGRIERQPTAAPPPPPAPAPRRQVDAPRATPPSPRPQPLPAVDDSPYDTAEGGDVYVQRGDTLWGVAQRVRPDSRLTMNQTMMAIFEANPQAFDGNINRLKAGVSLRIPSADEIYQISRGEALTQVRQQNAEWTGAPPPADTGPSLTLVPPDDEDLGLPYDDDAAVDPVVDEPMSREEELEAAIAEIEAQDVPDQQALIDIRNDQLAELRRELAEIRGETYVPPVDDTAVADDDTVFVDETDDAMADEEAVADDLEGLFPDDEVADEEITAADEAVDEAVVDEEPAPVSQARPEPEPSLVEKILGYVTGIYGIIAGAVIVVAAILFWFLRRGRGEEDDAAPWESLDDEEEMAAGALAATETLAAPKRDDDGMVVVEQDSAIRSLDDTMDAPVELQDSTAATGEFGSLEDTFSSETAVNLDQQDPLAEADFHMAYGLYDQAADLVNGALEASPGDKDLLAKLCEIYFVWGNRDAFIDAAGRLKTAVGDQDNADWDKVVIMGQQIAADDALFAGASAVAATRAVDLAFDGGMEDEAALDIDFGGDAAGDDVIDLGAEAPPAAGDDDGVDFLFGDTATEEGGEVDLSLEATAESPTIESPLEDEATAEVPTTDITKTVEMPPPDSTVETPTIEQQMADLGGTTELPAIDEDAMTGELPAGAEATAEINLDDLGLDVADLEATGTNEILEDIAEITGKNPEIDPNETGVRAALDPSETALGEKLDMDDALASTGEMRLARDETGASPALTSEEDTDVGLEDLLDATGMTQVISEDMAVETAADVDKLLGDDEATMMAGLDDEPTAAAPISDDDATTMAPSFSADGDEEFDFAKTEALPPEAFTGGDSLDETSEIPAVAETDVDLDLDDLTAALQVSQAGDTVDMPRDDATVEQPRPNIPEEASTIALAPGDLSDDLDEARTMTEVGTKLDLARAYVDMGDPAGARSILEEVLDEGDDAQRQQAQQLLDSLPS